MPTQAQTASISSFRMLDRIGSGESLPPPEPMPTADVSVHLPMRDGIRLETRVWLPLSAREGTRAPAILLRTPYKESVMGFKRLGVLRYVEAGYAVVIQLLRGIGGSEGRFSFSAPHERDDGYDTVEWIAAQPWCSGAVGMDGSSYVAITQLMAATAQPPHLRCIAPAVPSVDYFREIPYGGGAFGRQHTLNWVSLLQIDSLNELRGGFTGVLPILSHADVAARLLQRPLLEAAQGQLQGDFLQHYLDTLAHPTFDAWWQARTLSPADYARITVPTLVVNGNFDLGIGAMTLWKQLEAHAANANTRRLLIGPWDHGQCHSGGEVQRGPYVLGEHSVLDLGALRLAFFDEHLKGEGPGLDAALGLSAGERVRYFITGDNSWQQAAQFPPPSVMIREWFLASEGHANTVRGDGRLLPAPPSTPQKADRFVDDPTLPFIAAWSAAREGNLPLDLRERERHGETLVYDSGPLAEPLTLLGEGEVLLHTSADAPDADLALWLAEHRADGQTIKLATGQLRLRYRQGNAAEQLLEPGEVVAVRIPLTLVAHTLPAGSHLRLLVGGSNFPWADPNPHSGEPIATAVDCRPAIQTLFHDAQRPSSLRLPVHPP